MKKRFSLKYKVEEFELEMSDGVIRDAKIQEFDGLTRDKYLNQVTKKMNVSSSGQNQTGMKDHINMFADLLVLCLHVKNADGAYSLLSIDEIQKFPNSTQQELFEIASSVNSLTPVTKEEEDDRKNA